ncbi:MAG: hypothetical protein P3M72_00290 [Candidatus Hodgkinia cicadicola]|nr:MAG: hypothetical protein P3M72_00290 [Candidatus Hodgkinia cicadicola]
MLPYAKHVLNKVVGLLKRSMAKIGAHEVLMPSAISANVVATSLKANAELFIKTATKLVLVPTSEDVALALPTALALAKLYQVQSKFRNELRPSHNLVRSYEFIMKDCYMLFSFKHVLMAQLQLAMAEYLLVFKKLGINSIQAVADGGLLTSKHSFEFAAPSAFTAATTYYVHKHTLKLTHCPPRYLSFSKEYVLKHKIAIDASYLRMAGLEIAHAFAFNKIKRLNAWFASLGIGVSRIVGYALKTKPNNSSLLTVCSVAVLNATKLNKLRSLKGYPRYVYCVLSCSKLSCALFESKLHNSKLLGVLKRFPPKLIMFVNAPASNFPIEAVQQPACGLTLRCSLAQALKLAHCLE